MVKNVYSNLLDKLTSSKESVLLTYMSPTNDKSGSISKKLLLTRENINNDSCNLSNNKSLWEKIFYSLESGNIEFFNNKDNEMILIEPYFPKPRLIIFGGGHIAKPLVEFGAKVGYSVIVIDDRPSFANPNRFPMANKVICEDFQKSFDAIKPSKSDFVVIVTRGHRHDEVCLRKTLDFNTAYIGMIGSKRRVKGIKDKLLNEGYSQEQLNRVNAPIGLDIGGITPEEIAISIIGEVISFRRKGSYKDHLKSKEKFNWPEFDHMVIKEMAKEDTSPKALVTILSAKGSVPRKSGAKMIVWPHGKTLGSIGGGCSEADIVTKARDIILNRGYTIEHVDMTADMAEEEGMVCGGIMDVLIESF